MAELLVFMNDVSGDDVIRTTKLPKRGDVVTVQADGWPWGVKERADPMFRILAFPGQPVSAFTDLISNEAATLPDQKFGSLTNTLQYRGFRLDVDAATLPAAVRNAVADGRRTAAVVTVGTKAARDLVLAAKKARPPVADPAVIGKSARVIG